MALAPSARAINRREKTRIHEEDPYTREVRYYVSAVSARFGNGFKFLTRAQKKTVQFEICLRAGGDSYVFTGFNTQFVMKVKHTW